MARLVLCSVLLLALIALSFANNHQNKDKNSSNSNNNNNNKQQQKKKKYAIKVHKSPHGGSLIIDPHRVKLMSYRSCGSTQYSVVERCCSLPPLGRLFPSTELEKCLSSRSRAILDVASEFVLGKYQNEKPNCRAVDFNDKENRRELIPRANVMECTFNKLGLISNGNISLTNATAYFHSAANVEWKPMMDKVVKYCEKIIEQFPVRNLVVDSVPVASFSTDPLVFSQCIRYFTLTQCEKEGKMAKSTACKSTVSNFKSCFGVFRGCSGGSDTPNSNPRSTTPKYQVFTDYGR